MTELQKYTYKTRATNSIGTCEFCGKTDVKLMTDHCHKHDWIRGNLCRPCNQNFGRIDNNKATSITDLTKVNAYITRCPECMPLTELIPVLRKQDMKTLAITDTTVFTQYTELRFKLMGSVNRVLTTNELIGAFVAVSAIHYDELVTALDNGTDHRRTKKAE